MEGGVVDEAGDQEVRQSPPPFTIWICLYLIV